MINDSGGLVGQGNPYFEILCRRGIWLDWTFAVFIFYL